MSLLAWRFAIALQYGIDEDYRSRQLRPLARRDFARPGHRVR